MWTVTVGEAQSCRPGMMASVAVGVEAVALGWSRSRWVDTVALPIVTVLDAADS